MLPGQTFFALLGLLCSGGLASATDFWVGNAGNDAGPGSQAAPWRTIQRAVNAARPGDSILVMPGIYPEFVSFDGRSGTPGNPITLRAADPGDPPLIDGSTLTVPAREMRALVWINGSSHIVVQGLEIAHLASAAAGAVPIGIFVEGSGRSVALLDNDVHHIRQTRNSARGTDAHAIAVYGTGKSVPLSDITIKGNLVSDCLLGSSEAVVLNGNVDGFLVEDNTVRDCNNIGIDIIGFEGVSRGKKVDRARNGIVRGNLVLNIDTFHNPAYGGDPVSGGGDRSAAGIYVDGGTAVTIENNRVTNCNFGVELASEAPKGVTDSIILRNNILHHNTSAGLIMGGYDSKRGATRGCTVTGNTFYKNDTLHTETGQICLQWKVGNCAITDNIIWADPVLKQMVIHDPYMPKPNYRKMALGSGVVFDRNTYYHDGGGTTAGFVVIWNGRRRAYSSLDAWRSDPGGLHADANSTFGNPGIEEPDPDSITHGLREIPSDFDPDSNDGG